MTAAPQPASNDFDFDEWSALAKSDPAAFEQKRLDLIEDFLNSLPHHDQKRLRGLQFRIDMERRRARTPMAACLKLSAMMWDSLMGSRGLKNALDSLLTATLSPALQPAPAQPPVRNAHILPFRKTPR
jgi:hypothetical protein